MLRNTAFALSLLAVAQAQAASVFGSDITLGSNDRVISCNLNNFYFQTAFVLKNAALGRSMSAIAIDNLAANIVAMYENPYSTYNGGKRVAKLTSFENVRGSSKITLHFHIQEEYPGSTTQVSRFRVVVTKPHRVVYEYSELRDAKHRVTKKNGVYTAPYLNELYSKYSLYPANNSLWYLSATPQPKSITDVSVEIDPVQAGPADENPHLSGLQPSVQGSIYYRYVPKCDAKYVANANFVIAQPKDSNPHVGYCRMMPERQYVDDLRYGYARLIDYYTDLAENPAPIHDYYLKQQKDECDRLESLLELDDKNCPPNVSGCLPQHLSDQKAVNDCQAKLADTAALDDKVSKYADSLKLRADDQQTLKQRLEGIYRIPSSAPISTAPDCYPEAQ